MEETRAHREYLSSRPRERISSRAVDHDRYSPNRGRGRSSSHAGRGHRSPSYDRSSSRDSERSSRRGTSSHRAKSRAKTRYDGRGSRSPSPHHTNQYTKHERHSRSSSQHKHASRGHDSSPSHHHSAKQDDSARDGNHSPSHNGHSAYRSGNKSSRRPGVSSGRGDGRSRREEDDHDRFKSNSSRRNVHTPFLKSVAKEEGYAFGPSPNKREAVDYSPMRSGGSNQDNYRTPVVSNTQHARGSKPPDSRDYSGQWDQNTTPLGPTRKTGASRGHNSHAGASSPSRQGRSSVKDPSRSSDIGRSNANLSRAGSAASIAEDDEASTASQDRLKVPKEIDTLLQDNGSPGTLDTGYQTARDNQQYAKSVAQDEIFQPNSAEVSQSEGRAARGYNDGNSRRSTRRRKGIERLVEQN